MTEEEKYSILNDLSIQKTILENTFAQENLDEYDEELLEQYQEELDIYKRTIDYINKQADEIEKLKKEIEEKTTIIFAGAEKVKSLQKENEELKEDNLGIREENIKLVNCHISYERYTGLDFLLPDKFKYAIPKDKIREKLEELENEEKALRKDFEKHRVQLFELYKKAVLIEDYKKLLEEE